MFLKRRGIIHKDGPPPILNETTYIKCMIRYEMSKNCFYFVFNAYFTHCFKGLDVHHFQNYEDAPDLSVFLVKLKEISKTFYEKHKLINKAKVVVQMLELQHREEQMRVTKKEFKVDEELQLTQQMKNVTTPLKVFNEMRVKSKRSELGQPLL